MITGFACVSAFPLNLPLNIIGGFLIGFFGAQLFA